MDEAELVVFEPPGGLAVDRVDLEVGADIGHEFVRRGAIEPLLQLVETLDVEERHLIGVIRIARLHRLQRQVGERLLVEQPRRLVAAHVLANRRHRRDAMGAERQEEAVGTVREVGSEQGHTLLASAGAGQPNVDGAEPMLSLGGREGGLDHAPVGLGDHVEKAHADDGFGRLAGEPVNGAYGVADLAVGVELDQRVGGGERERHEAIAVCPQAGNDGGLVNHDVCGSRSRGSTPIGQSASLGAPGSGRYSYLPIIHLVFANLKTWLIGIHHGVSHQHLQAYLNEFTFRFNRRFYPFNAFRSLLGIAGDTSAPTYAELYSGEWRHPTCSGHGC